MESIDALYGSDYQLGAGIAKKAVRPAVLTLEIEEAKIKMKKILKIYVQFFLTLFFLAPTPLFGDVTVYEETFDYPWNTGYWDQYTPEGGEWATQLAPYVCQGNQAVSHHDDWDEPVNGWIISPGISLKAGITYTCSHLQRVGNSAYPENMGTYIYQGNGWEFTPAKAKATIWQADDLTNVTCETRSGTFTVPSDGNYSIVFHCTSAAGEFLAVWDDVKITKPTLVELISFAAKPGPHNILLSWETASEVDNAGFHLWRSETEGAGYERITDTLIPAEGSPTQGASYKHDDKNVEPGKTYYYKLEDMDTAGSRSYYGPVSATVHASIPTLTDAGLLLAGAVLAGIGAALLRRRRKELY